MRQGLAIGVSLVVGVSGALGGCSTITSLPSKATKAVFGGATPGQHLTGFIGGAVADEPRAALAAREILATGGNAADAAVTLGFMLAVTLPSRAALGAGGACLAYSPSSSSPNAGAPEAILFTPRAPATSSGGDRPAAVPMLARGLYLLSARYGSKPFESLVSPAEDLARIGHPISRAFARDLAQVARPLAADPSAGAVFAPDGRILGEGDRLVQTDLAGTLSQIRTVGVGDMYQGLLAHKLAEATAQAGGPVGLGDLRSALPALANPIVETSGEDRVAFLPPPADGGLGAAAAFQALAHGGAANAGAMSQAAAATWRAQGGDPQTILASGTLSGTLPALPASTSFVVVDRKGDAVACSITMDNLFGTGRVAPGTGIVLAASPAAKPMALLTAAIAWNGSRQAFRAAAGASGQNGAALAGAVGISQALSGQLPAQEPVPDPGRANAAGCTGYVPGSPDTCRFATDPRGAGLAAAGS